MPMPPSMNPAAMQGMPPGMGAGAGPAMAQAMPMPSAPAELGKGKRKSRKGGGKKNMRFRHGRKHGRKR